MHREVIMTQVCCASISLVRRSLEEIMAQSNALALQETELNEFRPCAYHCEHGDDITVLTKDVTTITRWIDSKCLLETLLDTKGKMVGFRLVAAKYLLRGEKSTSVRKLLMKALRHDMQVPRFKRISRLRLSILYIRATLLVALHRDTRNFT